MKQGAILSPLFYSLFVNELLVALEKSGLGVKIGIVYCSAPMYADDLALIASSAEELQAMMDVVSQYATKWRYRINPLKSKVQPVKYRIRNAREILQKNPKNYSRSPYYRCPKEGVGTLLGCFTIADLITTKKLSFLLSIAALPPDALPRQVLLCRLQESKAHIKSWIPLLESQINDLNLPDIATLINSKYSFQELLEKMHYKDSWNSCSPTPAEPGRSQERPRISLNVRPQLF